MVFDAVRMRLLEIGEAVGALPVELRATEPGVPWREIVGMRNWMAHRYFDTIHAYVWSTVDQDLGPLLTALERIAGRLDSELGTGPLGLVDGDGDGDRSKGPQR